MKKIFYYFILPITAFIVVYIGVFNFFYDSSPKQKDADNTTIQFILLITGIITITMLFVNFFIQKQQLKEQKDELEKNKEDLNYNRAIDLIYKQQDFSTHRIYAINNLNVVIQPFVDKVQNSFYSLAEEYNRLGNKELKKIKKLFKVLHDDLNIYKDVLEHTNLNEDQRVFLMKIVIENIYPKLYDTLRMFQAVYRDFQQGETFEKISKEDLTTKTILHDIEFDYACILDTVKIKVIEGLKLEE